MQTCDYQARIEIIVNFVLMDPDQPELYNAFMIGQRFRFARTAKKLTLREVGEAMNISAQGVANWEKTNPKLDSERMIALANLLEVSEDWLNGRAGADDEIDRPLEYAGSDGSVPLIGTNDAPAFAIFAQNDKQKLKVYHQVQPSVKLIGQGFAIIIDKEDEIGPLKEGDLAIFDNGRRAEHGDIVLGFLVEGETFYLHLLIAISADAQSKPEGYLRRKHFVSFIADEGSQADRRLETARKHLPIAVMTEFRRIQKPWVDDL